MKTFASRLPLPVTVLTMAWILMGTILEKFLPFLGDICMMIALILLFLTIFKFVMDIRGTYKFINTPVGISLFSTFSMSLMLLSVWMKNFLDRSNIYIWIVGIILQTIIMLIFTIKYLINFKLKNIYPSLFLVYSGMGIATITCNEFGMIVLGRWLYLFVIFISVALTPIILYRLLKYKMNQLSKPMISLFIVPVSIVLYSSIVLGGALADNYMWIVFVGIQIILIYIASSMGINLLYGFYPTWACYALSVSIGAFSSYRYNVYLNSIKQGKNYLDIIVYGECIFAFVVCVIVLLAYFINTLESPEVHELKIKKKLDEERKRLKNNSLINKLNRNNKVMDDMINRYEIKNEKKHIKKSSSYKNTDDKEEIFFEEEDLKDLLD